MMLVQKLNKKSKFYKVNATYICDEYGFIIDGSNHNNENSLSLKIYIWTLKKALIKYLKYYDLPEAIKKSSKYVNKTFRGKIKIPCIDLSLFKKNGDILETVVINNGKCYVKEKDTYLIQNETFSTKYEERFKERKSTKYLYLSLEDKNNYIYHEFKLSSVYGIILTSLPIYHFQKFLKVSNNEYFKYISRNGLKHIGDYLRNLEVHGNSMGYKKVSDYVCLYIMFD